MALQRTTEGRTSGNHSMTREQAEPFAIQAQRAIFLSYPPKEQARIRADVAQKLIDSARSAEFRTHPCALARFAKPVYGITLEDL